MTHQQLVEEWKEILKGVCGKLHVKDFLDGEAFKRIEVVLDRAMLASAKGAAEATKLEPDKNPKDDTDFGWNTAIHKSERQLDEYFKGI